MIVALEKGIQIPDDLSLIGYDNESLCQMFSPQLTSICPNYHEMGRIAISAIMNGDIWDASKEPLKIMLPAQLIKRNSVKNLCS